MHARGSKNRDRASIAVRRMTAMDVSSALSVLAESPEASMWSSESLLEYVSRGVAWAAELEGRVAGILIGRAAADEFEILNLAVGRACRRRGVATKLVTTALKDAQFAGAKKTFLEVRASNEVAIALYMRLGFRVCGRRRNYYRSPTEDAVLLVFDKRETNK
jgi:[ribosomal protein S18]-alanine N-acetyltransferase